MIRLTLEYMVAELGYKSIRAAGSIDHVFDAATVDLNLTGKARYSVADAWRSIRILYGL
jgi:hypothetical protein